MRKKACVSRARSVVIYGSFALALSGWVGSGWSWLDHGQGAGTDPGFIMALSVAIAFTVTLCVATVMPDQARIYGLGYRDGVTQGMLIGGEPEPSKLRAVR